MSEATDANVTVIDGHNWDAGPPGAVQLGSLLVSLLQPEPGDELGLHRWYERDHFYAGCMVGAYFFSGRRYVARAAHRAERYPDLSPLVPNVREGSQLTLYWIEQGHHDEVERWAVQKVLSLNEQDRIHPSRRSHAGFYDFAWSWNRDPDGVPVALALDHPYPGLVFLTVDRAEGIERSEVDAWYREEFLPGELAGSAVASCLAATPRALPDDAPSYVARIPGIDRRTLLLFFCERDPLELWPAVFGPHGQALAATGLGSVTFASPFIPTIPGTDALVRG
jgi:hypothetical protein